MPNILAYGMLLAWPLVTMILFKRLSLTQASIWTILGGYLVLPPLAHFDLPILPNLDKASIPNLCAFVGFLATRTEASSLLPRSVLVRLALCLFILAPIGTVFTNSDFIPLAVGGLPPMALQEIVSISLSNLIIVLPFLIGYQVLRDGPAMHDLLVALVLAGLIYSVPMLVEVRLSPQLNVWIYGFFQHSFDQMMRYGGFRPIVFLQHGLWVAFFAFMAALAAVALLKEEPETRKQRSFLICLYLVAVLLLCKSANAITYIVLFVPMVLFVPSRIQVRFAALVAVVVLLYPMLRGAGFIPTGTIADFAASIDADRAGSLIYRLNNEDILLDHSVARPWFGWGGWGRSLVHDVSTGELLTVVDGQWIITIGMFGWFGYLGEFGLLAIPLLLLARQTWRKNGDISAYGAVVALILMANLVDLIPNATLIPFTWLMAGAVLGYCEARVLAPSAAFKDAAPWARQQSQGQLR